MGVSELTDSFVKLNEDTRKKPEKACAEKYNELYAVQKEVSLALRGVFERHRKFVSKN
jgi:hypothetical protein